MKREYQLEVLSNQPFMLKTQNDEEIAFLGPMLQLELWPPKENENQEEIK